MTFSTTSKPRLIVHAGLHKTGTSYIQRFLHQNASILASRGIDYPAAPALRENHSHIASQVRLKALDKVTEALRGYASSKQPTVLISSEEFSTIFNNIGRTAVFLKMCGDLFSDVRFVYYLRRVDDLRESVYAQVVKGWYQGDIHGDMGFRFDPVERLQPLINAVGTQQITLRPYNRALWVEGDIALDLLHVAGLSDLRGLNRPKPLNESLQRRKTIFLSRIDTYSRESRTDFITAIRESGAIADDGVRYIASPRDRRRFYEEYRAGTESILRLFGISDADTFLAYRPPNDDWYPPEPITSEELDALAVDIRQHGFVLAGSKPHRIAQT